MQQHRRGTLSYRCKAKKCQRFVLPHAHHPLFWVSQDITLRDQAAVLFNAVLWVSHSVTKKQCDVHHDTIKRIYDKLDECRATFVRRHEKRIRFCNTYHWNDVEADECDFHSGLVADFKHAPDDEKVKWEQWCGVVERGVPASLVLWRLDPKETALRSPGPGAMRTHEWKPWAEKHLKGRKVILHTDGARAYRLKVDGVMHDHAVHKRKLLVDKNGKTVKQNGKNVWVRPRTASQ